MFTFLRRLRKSLIESNSTKKYLLYAIGEILLVVIGILIALQINNWNEEKKNDRREVQFLKGIQADLRKDSAFISYLLDLEKSRFRVAESIKPGMIENYFEFNLQGSSRRDVIKSYFDQIRALPSSLNDTILMKDYCRRGPAFRTTVGTFNALLSDGNTELIKNKLLFNQLQNFYLVHFVSINSIYETLKIAEHHLNSKHSRVIQFNKYKTPGQIKDRQLIADIGYMYQPKLLYFAQLIAQQINITQAIHQIEEELNR
ncbi:MAG: hypothetical protein KJP00_16935 [Bacteroidia bacterium]|nr:hypothetical protein [Bacteroidia bacterium]